MKTLLITMLWFAAPGPAVHPAQTPAVAPGEVATGEYLIGPKDVISLTIYNEESLSRPVLTVDAEGTVDCPLIGRVKVGGRTARQVEDILITRYSGEYLVNPSISVVVKEFRNLVVYVQGEVKLPGQVELKGDPTLVAALTEAGWFTSTAGSYVTLTRAGRGTTMGGPVMSNPSRPLEQLRISREDIDAGQAASIRLSAGDTVTVPKAASFFITGHVRAPNSYILSENLTVLQALALAGGATERAARNRIKIRRVVDGKTVEVSVKESDLVLPGDTIIVPPRFF
jgi:polysaccharide export outer membrane protein